EELERKLEKEFPSPVRRIESLQSVPSRRRIPLAEQVLSGDDFATFIPSSSKSLGKRTTISPSLASPVRRNVAAERSVVSPNLANSMGRSATAEKNILPSPMRG